MKYFLTVCLFVSALVFVWINYQAQSTRPEAAPTTLQGRVVDIIDGDSFKLRTKNGLHRVELYGVDAPEPGQPFGNMSTYYLADLIDGRDIELTHVETNEYGDLIGEVTIDGLSVNRLMLTEGYAWAKPGYFDDKKRSGMEAMARKSGLGLWRGGSPTAPWEWREIQQKG